MINHFRSLLLNLTAVGTGNPPAPHTAEGLHIDKSYSAITLPVDLQELYDVIYPTGDLETRLRLTHAYMMLLSATGLEESMTAMDPRVTYDLRHNQDFFKVRSCTTGIPFNSAATASGCHIRTFNNEFSPTPSQLASSYRVVMTQVSNTNQVQLQYGTDSLVTVPGSPVTLVFNGGFSQVVPVYNPALVTNLMFEFAVNSPGSFTGSSGKIWEFILTVPYQEILASQFTRLASMHGKITTAFSRYAGSPDPANYDRLWEKHHNPAYRMAGFLVGLVYRMNTLYFA